LDPTAVIEYTPAVVSVRWDPRIRGVPQPSDAEGNPNVGISKKVLEPTTHPETMGHSRCVPDNPPVEIPGTHSNLTYAISVIETEVAHLRRLLITGSKRARRSAATLALKFCSSYKARRSRGARNLALALCEDIAETLQDDRDLALKMHTILAAEGDLHEVSAEGTLRACFVLTRFFEEGKR
jgi:hypothetical protein